METTMEESTSLEVLPREILSYCFSLLSPDYSYWDLWRIALVNKIFFEQTNYIKDQFPKKIHSKWQPNIFRGESQHNTIIY